MKRMLFVLLGLAALGMAGPTAAQPKMVGQELVPPETAYSPGLMVDGTLYISGLQGADPTSHNLPTSFDQEAKTCLDNIGRVLKDAGMDYSNVVSVQIYLVDMNQFPAVNALYKTYFHGVLPTRTTVGVSKLSLGSRIEIAAVARKYAPPKNLRWLANRNTSFGDGRMTRPTPSPRGMRLQRRSLVRNPHFGSQSRAQQERWRPASLSEKLVNYLIIALIYDGRRDPGGACPSKLYARHSGRAVARSGRASIRGGSGDLR